MEFKELFAKAMIKKSFEPYFQNQVFNSNKTFFIVLNT